MKSATQKMDEKLASMPVFSDRGIAFHQGDDVGTALKSYVQQLFDEGYALGSLDEALIPWSRLYDLIADPAHSNSIALLDLPPVTPYRPVLGSSGTPSDSGFRIRIEGWRGTDGAVSPLAAQRTGGVLTVGGHDSLLPAGVFQLLALILQLHGEGPAWSTQQRMIALGRIQKYAGEVGATLDSYLSRTPVVVAEQLDLQLRSSAAVGADVIEIVPRPLGAPEEWLSQFDKFQSVRTRYDVSQAGGQLTHVLLPDNVMQALEPIRRLPARRVASEDADTFLHNPYAFFGDGADEALPPEFIEKAKREAGVVERELDASPADQGWDAFLVAVSGEVDDLVEFVSSMDDARALLALAASARQRSRPVIRWRGHRVSLGSTTLQSLGRLQQWTVEGSVRDFALRMGQVFDLAAYSDRVVGFDGKPIRVPVIRREDGSNEWVPENTGITIGEVDPASGQVSTTHLPPERVAELRGNVATAIREGQATVAVPGTTQSVPVPEAEAWLGGIKDVLARQSRVPMSPREPADNRRTPSLKILHNIEQLDYGDTPVSPSAVLGPPRVPAALRAGITLFPHQLEGLSRMQLQLSQQANGVTGILLADDMGLGKTLQCLALIAAYREIAADPKPCLVVAPVSLLENWKSEILTFLDGSQGKTVALYGDELAKYRLALSDLEPDLRELGLKKFLQPGFAQGAAIVLTTYETLRDYEFSLARESWGILVCDEAQKIKTPAALVTRAAKAMQADFKIACTGTPVENTLADLWCLFDFFQPALLGSLSGFTKKFRRAIELREAGHEQLIETLRGAIEPWVLRRMKSDVAELPPKIDEHHAEVDRDWMTLSMSPLQQGLYAATIAEFKAAVDAPAEDRKPGAALALLHRLRMICANPLGVKDPQAELLPVEEHVRHSPKLQWLLQQLERVSRKGEKVIVFTEYRELQRIVQRAVAGRFGIPVDVINGSTSVDPTLDASRQRLIDRFQAREGFGVIVLSTTAVGFGVNVQKANHVIHFTRSWNPAKEDQATDRAYRIGQDKPVWVYCPTVAGQGFESFEQRLAERLARKRSLSHDMLAPGQELGLSDFEDLAAN